MSISILTDAAATRGHLLALGMVPRAALEDGVVSRAELQNDPLWECDPLTDSWHKRTPEFFAARAAAEERLPGERDAAQIALGVALLELAGQLPPQADGPCTAVGPHGQLYETITSFDEWMLPAHRTPGEAIAEWRRRLLAYATSPGDTLWWRGRPEVDYRIPFGATEPRWGVWSRLAIGDGTSDPR